MKQNTGKKIKRILIVLLILIVVAACCVVGVYLYSRQIKQESEKMIVGTWEYVKITDENNQEIQDSEEQDMDLSVSLKQNYEGTANFSGLLTVNLNWKFEKADMVGNRLFEIHTNGGQILGEETDSDTIITAEIPANSESLLGEEGICLCLWSSNAEADDALATMRIILKKVSDTPTDFGTVTFDDFEGLLENEKEDDRQPTIGEQNALEKAYSYLEYTAFSYTGLIDQLEFEGFSNSEATYAADHCGADWNEQAALKAREYLDYSSFSRSELIDQLVFEGFTQEQAVYGAEANGY